MRLAWKFLSTPSRSDTVETVTFSDSNDVDHLVLLEDGADLDGLLEKSMAKGNLVSNAAAIDLNLHKVGLLLLEWCFRDLSMGEDADDGAVLLDTLELAGDGLAAILGMLLGVLGEGLLLALIPVLVESSLDLVAQMLSPHRGKGT